MSVPFSQAWTVASYVLRQRLRRVRRFPLVLMLEPLFRCNLACAGCGKIQHPGEVLRRHLSPKQCWAAADECGAPIVSIPGGEPLLHPEIDRIVEGLVARRKYVYLCTNALKLEESLPRFRPTKYLTFSIHLDGPREEHDRAVCREGVYDAAIAAIRAARSGGFRVTTNTTLFLGSDPDGCRRLFDELMTLGVEGITISPGYSYTKAPDQEHFLHRDETVRLFRRILGNGGRRWRFNQSPLFLQYLQGRWDLECTPWGNPTYNLFGWQRPCYLVDEGYCATFQELIETTDWDAYGHASGNPKCRDCMVHCGHEPTAVIETFSSLRALWTTARLMLFGQRREEAREQGLGAREMMCGREDPREDRGSTGAGRGMLLGQPCEPQSLGESNPSAPSRPPVAASPSASSQRSTSPPPARVDPPHPTPTRPAARKLHQIELPAASTRGD